MYDLVNLLIMYNVELDVVNNIICTLAVGRQ